jgi:LacI family transcriptional regulator, gluconate utilization system Gnt-I transcriptional repressor
MRRTKMADVAKAAEVSTMTVSRALKRDGRIAPATRRRILEVVQELGYVPDRLAASFSSQRSGFVAVLVPSLNNPHFAESVSALSETIERDGVQILLGHTNYDPAREQQLIADLLPRRPEAIVVTADAHSARTRKLLAGAGIPVVEFWDLPPKPLGHSIGFSNIDAARAMTRHLVLCGYRRIAYVGETQDAGTRGSRRREGFVKAITELGFPANRIYRHAPPPVGMSEGRIAFGEVMRLWPDTDAILCVSDPCAYGVMIEAIARGVSIPYEIGIAGFGDFEIGRCSVPTLTTIGIDAFELGRATGALLRRLNDGKTHHVEVVPQPVSIIARQSTRDIETPRVPLSDIS